MALTLMITQIQILSGLLAFQFPRTETKRPQKFHSFLPELSQKHQENFFSGRSPDACAGAGYGEHR